MDAGLVIGISLAVVFMAAWGVLFYLRVIKGKGANVSDLFKSEDK